MSRSKVSILSKYVMAIAILALLFSVAITTARYAVSSYGSSSIGIESFDVDVKLLDENRNEVSGDIPLNDTTEDLSSYTKVYYLYINNNDNDTLYYKIEEQSGNFCFTVGSEDTTRYTTYGGELNATTSTELTLTLSVHPDVTIKTGETQSLTISLYAEYQHTEAYESDEVEEPEIPYEDTNHNSNDWNYLSNENVSGATLSTAGNYCLIEDVGLTAALTISANITLCLNGHTLTAASGYSASQLINITGGSVTIENCQSGGSINGGSLAQAISLSGSGASLTLTTASITGGLYNVAISSGATLNLNGATLTSGSTGSVNISNGTFYLNSGTINGNSQTGVNVNGSSASFNMSGGTITGASKGIATTNGAKVNISGGTITSCSNSGIDLVSAATLTLSGTPVISGSTSKNVYLESGARISLGELTSGANVGVTSATSITDSNSVQISSTETNTYNYESAISYIHSDNSSYKVSSGHSGYLSLIGKDYLNITFALEGTSNSKPSDTPTNTNYDGNYYIEGFDGNWNHVDSNYCCTEALSTYNGSYSYDLYYDMGLSGTATTIDFVISPYMWDSDMGGLGLGPDNSLASIGWSGSYNNFNLNVKQGSYVTERGSSYYTWSNWELAFGDDYSKTNGMTTILEGIGDFTIVLQLNYKSVTFDWGSVNNIVSDVYFIADGLKINSTR